MITQGEFGATRVILGGTIIDTRYSDNHTWLIVAFEQRFQLRLVVNNTQLEDSQGMIGAQIEATGMPSPTPDTVVDNTGPLQVFVPDTSDLVVYRRGPTSPFGATPISVENMAKRFRSSRESPLIRMRGRLLSQPEPRLVVLQSQYTTNRFQVRLRKTVTAITNSIVDVAGIAWKDGNDPVYLDRAILRPASKNDFTLKPDDSKLPILKSAQAIRGLSPEQAATGYPVDLMGTVTYYDPRWRVLFVQDATGGIYVDKKDRTHQFKIGDRIRVRGISDPGGFSPMVKARQLNPHEPAELPTPRTPGFGRLLSGAEDCQWVRLDGVVEAVTRSQKNLQLRLRHPEGEFEAIIMGAGPTLKATNWIGSRIDLIGVCAIKANTRRQVTGILFHVPDINHVKFIDAAPKNPFDRPNTPLSDLLRFEDSEQRLQQVKATGTVTYSGTTGLTAVQDESQAILVRFPTNSVPGPGDLIEILGFPTPGAFQPTLRQPRWRSIGSTNLPAPLSLDAHAALDQESAGKLVTLDATVTENHSASAVPTLTLQAKGIIFSADLSALGSAAALPDLAPGSIARVTGVCSIQADEWNTPRSFRLLVPRGSTVTVLQEPDWLTTEHLLGTAATLAAIVFGGMIWVFTLRSRVTRQTDRIRRDLEEKSRLSARYDELVENAGDVIFTLNPTGEFTSANTAAERIFGQPRQKLIGTAVVDRLDHDSIEHLYRAFALLSAKHPITGIELKTGTASHARILETSLHFQARGGALDEIQCIARDVTGRRSLEAQVRQMQKMESVGQLAAGVAHDYNNIMTVIVANSDIMLEEQATSGEHTEMMQEVHDAAARAANLTSQLLAFSRRQIIHPEVIEPADMLTGLLGMLRRLIGENIALKTEIPDTLPSVRADRGMIDQAILNLALNARDAMPDGGTLTIRADALTLTHGDADRHPDAMPGPHLRISIDDTGTGIAPENLTRIFDPFFTTKEVGQGSGLGLSTVFGIAKQHEGWIKVNTGADQGSNFQIFLPTTEDAIENSADSPDGDADHSGNETILVVEDEESVRLTVTKVLRRAGYRVLAAADGPSALEIWSHQGNSVDLLLTDMVMPGGITGRELADDIRASHPELLTLFCSGYSVEFTGLTALTEQERLLPKPFENKMLIKAVRELLDSVMPVERAHV
jgi:PAS domain S-box-containing protein